MLVWLFDFLSDFYRGFECVPLSDLAGDYGLVDGFVHCFVDRAEHDPRFDPAEDWAIYP